MLDIIESIFAIAFLASIIVTAIVGTVRPKENSFIWKIVNILNYISIVNPRGYRVIRWDEFNKLNDKEQQDEKD